VSSIYQATFFLSVALLAIAITVFVLAVSLLGRAVTIAAREEEKVEKERKEGNEGEIKKIQGQLEDAKSKGAQVDVVGLQKSLNNLRKIDRQHDRRLSWIRWKPRLLTANWAAFAPGALFLIAAILSALALRYVETESPLPFGLWVSSLFVMLGGILCTCLTLRVIQEIAVTSEEVSFSRQKEVFVKALSEFEEIKKPALKLHWREQMPPLRMKMDTILELKFGVSLEHGECAENVTASFFLPEGFSFPGSKTLAQPEYIPIVAKMVTLAISFSAITPGIILAHDIAIKAPSSAGEFICYYRLSSRGFVGDYEQLKIVVE